MTDWTVIAGCTCSRCRDTATAAIPVTVNETGVYRKPTTSDDPPTISDEYAPTQLDSVFDAISERMDSGAGAWMTLEEIAAAAKVRTLSSVGSRLRDLRTEGFRIERRSHPQSGPGARIFQYRRHA